MKEKPTIHEYISVIIVIVFFTGFFLGLFIVDNKYKQDQDISSETKAFTSDHFTCDLYIHYEGEKITNIELLGCIEK